MLLDKLTSSELIIANLIVLVIILCMVFKWFFKQIREICEKASGILVLGQVTFLFFSWGCFIAIFLIFAFKGEKVSALSLILTVVVGFLGTITGTLFNQDAIKRLYEDRLTRKDERLTNHLEYFNELPSLLEEIKKEIETKKSRR